MVINNSHLWLKNTEIFGKAFGRERKTLIWCRKEGFSKIFVWSLERGGQDILAGKGDGLENWGETRRRLCTCSLICIYLACVWFALYLFGIVFALYFFICIVFVLYVCKPVRMHPADASKEEKAGRGKFWKTFSEDLFTSENSKNGQHWIELFFLCFFIQISEWRTRSVGEG